MNTTPIEDKIPLVIGISGHRNPHPDEIELLKQRVSEVFDFLQKSYPHTPLLLISPLAEGADRLAAHVAIEKNIPFIAPFPLPENEYRRDFKTPECQQEFDDLLSKARDHFELPILNSGIAEKKSRARRIQYALVGAYVARHSHILLALWDGRETQDIGGTYQIMQYRLKGDMLELPDIYKPSSNLLDCIDTGKVCHLKVSRAPDDKHPNNQRLVDAGEIYILSPADPNRPQKDLKLLLTNEFKQIDDFNKDVERYTEKYGKIKYKSILKPELLKNLSKPFHAINRLYEVASTLSIENRRPTDHAIWWLFFLGIAMVTAIELYAHPFWLNVAETGHPNGLLGVYLGLFGCGYVIFYRATKQAIQLKYLHYRSLTEALRIQIYWLLGGLKEKSVADFYSRKHRGELAWIQSSLRALALQNWVNDRVSPDIVRDKWVTGQLNYFREQSRQKRCSVHRGKISTKIAFSLGFILTVVLLILDGSGWLHHHHAWQNGLIVLMILFPATGAAFDGYLEKMGFEQDIKRYQQMIEIFERAQEILMTADEASYQRLLLELGKAALEENSDWVLLHRDRPLDLPRS